MVEDDHYICGEIDHGRLPLILEAAREVMPTEAVSVYESGFDGQKLIRLYSDSVDMETEQGSRDLFGGVAGRTIVEAQAFLGAFASTLASRGVEHRFELYSQNHDLVCEFSYGS
jgi:hypothetical protein